MKLSRPSRSFAALIALVSMLFMQLAVSAYACPGIGMAMGEQWLQQDQAASVMADMEMSGCHEMDPVQPSLCHAYGQSGNHSLDKPEIPSVQPFMAAGLALSLSPLLVKSHSANFLTEDIFLAHATAPPAAIRNCCFRI